MLVVAVLLVLVLVVVVLVLVFVRVDTDAGRAGVGDAGGDGDADCDLDDDADAVFSPFPRGDASAACPSAMSPWRRRVIWSRRAFIPSSSSSSLSSVFARSAAGDLATGADEGDMVGVAGRTAGAALASLRAVTIINSAILGLCARFLLRRGERNRTPETLER
jgi:hypothetical protein